MSKDEEKSTIGAGEETGLEGFINHYLGNAIHLFLSLLALMILSAAVIGAYDTLVGEFPKLFAPVDEYKVLQQIIQNILLVAIAAELGLLLLFHRTSAAIEVIIFVVARKMVSPEVTALDLLICVAALVALIIVRFYYVPGRVK